MNTRNEVLRAALDATPEQLTRALDSLMGAAPTPRSLEPYLTLRQLAKRLGVSTTSLWRWRVPGHRIGGRRRFKLSEVVEFLESLEENGKRVGTQDLKEDGI